MTREVAVVYHSTHNLYYLTILKDGKLDIDECCGILQSGDNVGHLHKHAHSLADVFKLPVRTHATIIGDWSELL